MATLPQNNNTLTWNPNLLPGLTPNNPQAQVPTPSTTASSTSKPVVVSSNPARKEFNTHSMTLGQMLSSLNNQSTGLPSDNITLDSQQNDPYIKLLNQQSMLDDAASKALIATIRASKYNNQNQVTQSYDNYKKGLQLLGIQHNEAQFTPDLLQGRIQQVEVQKIQELQKYEIEANKALIDARQAQASGNLALFREKMNYIKDLKDERDNYLKKLASNLEAETSIAENRAEAIYGQMQSLNPAERETYLNAVAEKSGIPVTSLMAALQRVAESKTSKSGGGSSGGGYTSQELRKLRQAGIDPADIESADDFLYGDSSSYSKADLENALNNLVDDNLDEEGYITKEGLQNAIKAGQSIGMTRSEVLKKFKSYIYTGNNRAIKRYGLTKADLGSLGL